MTDLRVTRLSNGLRVVSERVSTTRSLAAGVWVGIGARDEPAPLAGVSHFLEHLLFKGTPTRSAMDISRAVDRVGGDLNAYTNKEHTAFVCRVPERVGGVALELLGDIIGSPTLSDADVEVERRVILEELAMDDDSPDDVAHRAFARSLWPDHPLGRDTAGARDTVERISGDDVRAFFATHYRSGSMVVSVASPWEHDEVVAAVERCFAAVPAGDGGVPRLAPGDSGEGVSIVDETEQVQLVLGGRGLARGDEDREALDVVNHAFGGGLSSRLFDVVREQRGLVYSIFSHVITYADSGAWSVVAGTQPDSADEVIELVVAELDRLRRRGLADDELDIARGALVGMFEMGLEDAGSRMSRNGGLLTSRGEIPTVDEQIQRWQAVDRSAVDRVIERVFTAPPIVVSVGPEAVGVRSGR